MLRSQHPSRNIALKGVPVRRVQPCGCSQPRRCSAPGPPPLPPLRSGGKVLRSKAARRWPVGGNALLTQKPPSSLRKSAWQSAQAFLTAVKALLASAYAAPDFAVTAPSFSDVLMNSSM